MKTHKKDKVTFVTKENNWEKSGSVKELKINKSEDVLQIKFENDDVVEIHAFDVGSGRPCLLVSDMIAPVNLQPN